MFRCTKILQNFWNEFKSGGASREQCFQCERKVRKREQKSDKESDRHYECKTKLKMSHVIRLTVRVHSLLGFQVIKKSNSYSNRMDKKLHFLLYFRCFDIISLNFRIVIAVQIFLHFFRCRLNRKLLKSFCLFQIHFKRAEQQSASQQKKKKKLGTFTGFLSI